MEKRDYHMWSDDEDTVLISLREAGHPVKHIAKVMERSVSSVTNRIYIKRVPLVARQMEMDFGHMPELQKETPSILSRIFSKLLG
jgi:uncharacterized Fe-S cluster-containing protein